MEGRSILTHPDPQRLVNAKAGSGIKRSGDYPGQPGYKELVNFGEPIGDVYSKEGGLLYKQSTWGTIHYAKDGTHIVPAKPPELPIE